MDYIDYEFDKMERQQERMEAMAELGFDNVDEYYEYLADKKAEYQEREMEARRLEEEF